VSRLVLVRHAQASFSPDPGHAFGDYDRLSPLGVRQAEALGEELAAGRAVFDRLYVGPAERHRATAEAVGRVYAREGVRWGTPDARAGLGEHEGARVVARALEHADFAEERARLAEGTARAYLRVFRAVTRRWAREELPGLSHESWQAFRARVADEVNGILSELGRGTTAIAFTSGGPIGSTAASALGLGDERALELAWMVENATVTEFLFDGERLSLKSFNVQPRLGRTDMFTHV